MPWQGGFWNYAEHDGMMVPTEAEVTWLPSALLPQQADFNFISVLNCICGTFSWNIVKLTTFSPRCVLTYGFEAGALEIAGL